MGLGRDGVRQWLTGSDAGGELMGCLNADQGFNHWCGNIHLSGPCNRACYFCIGQHMMALDALNVLDTWPLPGIGEFARRCRDRDVNEINVTGTNTDPLLYRHTGELHEYLKEQVPGLVLGLRTNGIAWATERWRFYDKLSVTVCSMDLVIYQLMMGRGEPPDLKQIIVDVAPRPLKVNVVLGPENVAHLDFMRTIEACAELGIRRINLREPYGQPHVGDPLLRFGLEPSKMVHGMPCYRWRTTEITYWDVHYVEVESVNLYAQGRVSETYPITKGHDDAGEVRDQSQWSGGRVREQWVSGAKR
jgi:hypothetical protein